MSDSAWMCSGIEFHAAGPACERARSPNLIINVNAVVERALQSAGIPVTNEPVGLTRLNGKRPDGLTLIPWQGDKPLIWDVTVVSTLAASYLSSSARSARAANRPRCHTSRNKNTVLVDSDIFQPIAVESHCAFSPSALSFLATLDEHLTGTSGNLREM